MGAAVSDTYAALRRLADLRSVLHDARGGFGEADPQPLPIWSLTAEVIAAEDALWPGYGTLRLCLGSTLGRMPSDAEAYPGLRRGWLGALADHPERTGHPKMGDLAVVYAAMKIADRDRWSDSAIGALARMSWRISREIESEIPSYPFGERLASMGSIYKRQYTGVWIDEARHLTPQQLAHLTSPMPRTAAMVGQRHGKSRGFANPRRSALGSWGRSLVAALRPLIGAPA